MNSNRPLRAGACLALALLGAAPVPAHATAQFAAIFGDHMVLQREQPIRVSGTASASARLTVRLGETSRELRADASGNWSVELPALAVGGPYTMTLTENKQLAQSLHDIMIGDVWLCSGQSNMEFPVSRASGNVGDRSAQHEKIRLLNVPHASAVTPLPAHDPASSWVIADATSTPDFSAVCFYFGRELQRTEDVPLGLISASWGGSRIEPWISQQGLRAAGGLDADLDLLQLYVSAPHAGMRRYATAWEQWWQNVAGPVTPWVDTPPSDDSGWQSAPVGMRDWKTFGDPALAEHNGMVWYRKTFELSAMQAAQDATLDLGGIDEIDVSWVNGEFIGTQFGWGTPRGYPVQASVLRAGANNIVLNILSHWASGGMLGPDEDVKLSFADGSELALDRGWTYRKVDTALGIPPRTPWQSIGGLSGMFNAMLAPLQPLRLAGAIWYQGESNSGDARYADLLRALTADWRRTFNASLPVLIVQLPNFGPLATAPYESGWATVRDAQRRVAREEARTGLVVTVDVGDYLDLHPAHKVVVGERAAAVARAMAQDGSAPVDGWQPTKAIRQGTQVIVEFAVPKDALYVVGARQPIGFELCAGQHCVFADARLDGNRVILDTTDATAIDRVRYAWADAPICNLYGRGGLPVSTFEIAVD